MLGKVFLTQIVSFFLLSTGVIWNLRESKLYRQIRPRNLCEQQENQVAQSMGRDQPCSVSLHREMNEMSGPEDLAGCRPQIRWEAVTCITYGEAPNPSIFIHFRLFLEEQVRFCGKLTSKEISEKSA